MHTLKEELLSYAGYSFNPDSKKDIIVKLFIENQKFDKFFLFMDTVLKWTAIWD